MKTRYSLVALLVVAGMLLAACGGAATPAPTTAPAAPAVQPTTAPAAQPTTAPAPAAGGLTGEITLWHSYHAGGSEEKAIGDAVAQLMKDNPDLKVNVLEIPFDQIENKWSTEVAAGAGPDMFTMPNDNLGTWVRGNLVAPVDDLMKDHVGDFSKAGIDGLTVDGKLYGVPGIIKALALAYNKSTVPNPPKTTDELLQMVKDGKKLVVNQSAYYNFGWMQGAFGGNLMDASGTCVADQGTGFTDAFQYLLDLKKAGADFETDGGKADTMIEQGQADMMVEGPWMLGDFKKALGDKLGIAPMPAGPKGPAQPLSGIDGWYINPNATPEQQKLAVAVGLYLFGQKGASFWANEAGDPMVANGLTVDDPLVKAYADAAAAGFPRPQSKEFSNWWGPFGDAVTKVMEGTLSPADAVKEACAAMNKANGKTGASSAPAPAAPITNLGGEITLWHSYHAGGSEEKAIGDAVAQLMKDNPDLKVNVLEIPFDQIENKWSTEVAAGAGPDMFTMPNDNLGTWVRGNLVAPVDDLMKDHVGDFSKAGIDGLTVDGKLYGVPGIIKALALAYNKSTVPNPPKTTDELLQMVKDGKKLVVNQSAYYNFGWMQGAFGGKLMDDTGKCIADQGTGFTDAFQYLLDLKKAGADFETDGGKADTMIEQGQADMMVEGPWMLGDFKKALGDKLGIAPMPAGPKGPAQPLSGIDGWYINPNATPEQQKLAVAVGLYLFGQKGASFWANEAGDPMVANGLTVDDPLVKAYADAAAAGFPRPQSKEFSNWWGPFGDAVTKVMEGTLSPADAVKEACAAMNKANGK
jgi:arabinogalactan oligomer/maltooligosaccharide transport system substrate-binding protein